MVAIGIIGLVLIQHGKGADAGAAFGSGSSGSVFGSKGAGSFLSRATAILAVVFFTNSMGLAWMVADQTRGSAPSVTDTLTPATLEGSIVPDDVPMGDAAQGSDIPAAVASEAQPVSDIPAAVVEPAKKAE